MFIASAWLKAFVAQVITKCNQMKVYAVDLRTAGLKAKYMFCINVISRYSWH